ncbi:helix-turn-helix domain-containing protein [Anaerococcus faecalis]
MVFGTTFWVALKVCELSPATISKMGRGEFVSMEVLYRIGTRLDVDFGDMVSIIEQKK